MASTYDTARSRPLDRVRAKVRDVGQFLADGTGAREITGAISTDEEIQSLIDIHGEQEAAALLAEEHAAYFSLEPNSITQVNGISYSYSDRAKGLLAIASAIRASASPSRNTGQYGTSSGTVSVANDVQY